MFHVDHFSLCRSHLFMLYRSNPFWGNCLWFRLGTREPYRLSTSPQLQRTSKIYANSSIQVVGLILNLAAVTGPECGIQIRGPWVGLETFERLRKPRRPRACRRIGPGRRVGRRRRARGGGGRSSRAGQRRLGGLAAGARHGGGGRAVGASMRRAGPLKRHMSE